MFVLTLLSDSIRIPPPLLSQPTLTSIQSEIEKRYPNKIIIDVGLIICPYGPPLQIGDGILVPGDGGAHHQVIFQCLVFRPFVEEVLVGTVTESHEEGVTVCVGGFFESVFIPAYWMLNPSVYDDTTGLWVWTPTYDDDDEASEASNDDTRDDTNDQTNDETNDETNDTPVDAAIAEHDATTPGHSGEEDDEQPTQPENRFEIEIGSEIRFKVKSVNFTRITTTMKGVQATTTTTAHVSDRAFALNGANSTAGGSAEGNGEIDGGGGGGTNGAEGGSADGGGGGAAPGGGIRRRSSSADLSDSQNRPAPMQIVGSICEDGLGLTSWWMNAEDEEEEEEEEDDKEGGGGGGEVEDESGQADYICNY